VHRLRSWLPFFVSACLRRLLSRQPTGTTRRQTRKVLADFTRFLPPLWEDKSFFKWCAALLGAMAFLKGIRLPNSWSFTQAQLDYRYGFIKRAFFGEIFTRHLALNIYGHFVVFSLLVLLLMFALLVSFIWKSGTTERLASGALVVLFLSSFTVTYLASLVGYLDIVELALTLALLLIRRSLLRFLAALPVCVVCALIHEEFLVLFLPLLLFSFVADEVAGLLRKGQLVAFTGSLSVLSLAVTVVTAASRSLTPAQCRAFAAAIAKQVNVPIRWDFFDVLFRSFMDNVRFQFMNLRTHPWYIANEISSALIFAPVIALLLFAAFRLLRDEVQERPRRTLLMAAVLIIALCPVGLQLVGVDIARWDAYAALDAFLALVLIARALPEGGVSPRPTLMRAVLLVVFLNIASGENLLDSKPLNPYPFLYTATRVAYHIAKEGTSAISPTTGQRDTSTATPESTGR
jgi:hypothetical protein